MRRDLPDREERDAWSGNPTDRRRAASRKAARQSLAPSGTRDQAQQDRRAAPRRQRTRPARPLPDGTARRAAARRRPAGARQGRRSEIEPAAWPRPTTRGRRGARDRPRRGAAPMAGASRPRAARRQRSAPQGPVVPAATTRKRYGIAGDAVRSRTPVLAEQRSSEPRVEPEVLPSAAQYRRRACATCSSGLFAARGARSRPKIERTRSAPLIAGPALDDAELARVMERDVDRAVAALGEPADRPAARRGSSGSGRRPLARDPGDECRPASCGRIAVDPLLVGERSRRAERHHQDQGTDRPRRQEHVLDDTHPRRFRGRPRAGRGSRAGGRRPGSAARVRAVAGGR